MKPRRTTTPGSARTALQMTPMIDIVFQLLVFFILTFKIVSQEGDFNIKMPLAEVGASHWAALHVETLRVRLEADGEGKLFRMSLNGRLLPFLEGKDGRLDMQHLQDEIVSLIGGAEREADGIRSHAEVELDCDFGLNYVHVIEAITAVSGYRGDDDTVITLIDKITFGPPRRPLSRKDSNATPQ